jgi:tripartite-type tricarboxylate transporter receptor subunit TctC
MTRAAIRTALAVAVGIAAAAQASAQTYPSRPIKIIVPTPPGGPVDTVARVVANGIGKVLGQSVVVDNRPGAGNTIGSKEAALADPDGYTLHYSSSSGLIIAPMLQKNAGYDPITSFEPIALVAQSTEILVVNPSLPVKSVPELVAYAKAHPGKVNFSSGGVGVLPHLIGEWFKSAAGIDVVHVHYRGGAPSINGLVAGDVQFTFEGTGVLIPLIEAGKLRALATPSKSRIREMPGLPTMIESGFPGFVATSWTGLLAPAKTPRPIIIKLNAAVNEAAKTPEFKTALAKLSTDVVGGAPEDLAVMIKEELGRWGPVVKSLNLTQ